MKASRTALMVAAYRGRATRDNQLIDDPWAAELAGEDGLAYAEQLDTIFPWMQLWIALRTHFIDRCIAQSDAQQIVNLGAGLDTRAARFPKPRRRFFEVDRPASSAIKQERIHGLATYPADAATYVSCDFETQDVIAQLAASGFDASEPAFFICEGVTPYLTEEAIRDTLARVASCHPRSILTFDYVGRSTGQNQRLKDANRETRKLIERMGEPIRFGTDDVLPFLAEAGYRWVRTARFDELALSWDGSYDPDRGMRFQSMCLASRESRVQIG